MVQNLRFASIVNYLFRQCLPSHSPCFECCFNRFDVTAVQLIEIITWAEKQSPGDIDTENIDRFRFDTLFGRKDAKWIWNGLLCSEPMPPNCMTGIVLSCLGRLCGFLWMMCHNSSTGIPPDTNMSRIVMMVASFELTTSVEFITCELECDLIPSSDASWMNRSRKQKNWQITANESNCMQRCRLATGQSFYCHCGKVADANFVASKIRCEFRPSSSKYACLQQESAKLL